MRRLHPTNSQHKEAANYHISEETILHFILRLTIKTCCLSTKKTTPSRADVYFHVRKPEEAHVLIAPCTLFFLLFAFSVQHHLARNYLWLHPLRFNTNSEINSASRAAPRNLFFKTKALICTNCAPYSASTNQHCFSSLRAFPPPITSKILSSPPS